MLNLKNIITIDKNEDLYLSFPDIIRSVKKPEHFFLIYRSGNAHHPITSKLILKKSINNGKTWNTIQEFILNMEDNKCVWNCPRLSYINKVLYIVCDTKSSTFERQAQFKTFFLTSTTEGKFFKIIETPIPGMVPDKIISFKGKYFCANHKIKNRHNELIQLISWSKDGKIWYDTNIMAHSNICQFCEASVVNIKDQYLISYLRDNSDHKRNIYYITSSDGIEWSKPKKLDVFGQRVTALKRSNKEVIGSFRNTNNTNVSLFIHDLNNNKIKIIDIDEEFDYNQYHYGYTGLVESDKEYLLTYYIKKETNNPYINLAFISK